MGGCCCKSSNKDAKTNIVATTVIETKQEDEDIYVLTPAQTLIKYLNELLQFTKEKLLVLNFSENL